jgi:hypothetical protein
MSVIIVGYGHGIFGHGEYGVGWQGTVDGSCIIPRVGLEPTRCYHHQILNLARLPISPPRLGMDYHAVTHRKKQGLSLLGLI